MQRGLIFNERTGKTIKIGAATYNKLVLDGYTPDRAAGVLTPPTSSRAGSNGRSRSAPGLCPSLYRTACRARATHMLYAAPVQASQVSIRCWQC